MTTGTALKANTGLTQKHLSGNAGPALHFLPACCSSTGIVMGHNEKRVELGRAGEMREQVLTRSEEGWIGGALEGTEPTWGKRQSDLILRAQLRFKNSMAAAGRRKRVRRGKVPMSSTGAVSPVQLRFQGETWTSFIALWQGSQISVCFFSKNK